VIYFYVRLSEHISYSAVKRFLMHFDADTMYLSHMQHDPCLCFGSRPSDHYFRSVCLFVCLSVCLCRVFLSRLWSDFDQTRTYVICLGL